MNSYSIKPLGQTGRLELSRGCDELPREAFGVCGAYSRFQTASRLTTAPASWTHSRRFAQFACGFAALHCNSRDCSQPAKRLFGFPFFHSPIPVDRKSTRLNSSHRCISYAVFCLKKK